MANLTSQLVVELLDRVTAPARKVASSLAGITGAVRDANGTPIGFGTRLDAAITRNNEAIERARGGMLDAVASLYTLRAALSAPISSAQAMETALAELGAKGNLGAEALARIRDQASATGREVNQFALDVVKAQDFLVGMGLSVDASSAAIETIGRAATATRSDLLEMSQAGFAAMSNLQVAPEDLGHALDAMAAAGKAGGFELRDMASHFPAIGAAYQALGQTGVGAVSDLSAALQIMRKGTGDASSAATNLQNVIQKMQSPATVRAFDKMGVNLEAELKAAAERGLTPLEAIAEITNRTLEGDLSRLGYLFEDSQAQAGVRSLIQNLEEYRKIREEAAGAGGTIDADFARMMQTNEERAKALKIAVADLQGAIGAGLLPVLRRITDLLRPMVEGLGRMAREFPGLTSAVITATAAVIGFQAAMHGLRFLGLMGRGGVLSLLSLGFNSIGRAAIGARNAASSMIALQTALAGMGGQSLGTLGRIGAGMRGIALAVPGMGLLGSALSAVGAAIAAISAPAWGAIVAGILAVAAVGATIYKNWDRIAATFSGVAARLGEEFAPALELARPLIDWLSGVGATIGAGWDAAKAALSGFWEWFGGFFAKDVLTEEQKAAAAQSGYDLADRMIEGIKGIPAKIIATASEWFNAGKALIQALWDGMVAIFDSMVAWVDEKIEAMLKPLRDAKAYLSSWNPFGGEEAGGSGGVDGARAKGGPISRGGTYLVGEKGPELITASRSGYVNPNGSTSGASIGTVNISAPVTVTGGAADPEAIAQKVARTIEEKVRETFRGVFADAGMRFS